MTGQSPARVASPGTRPAGAEDEAAAARQVREMFSGIAPRYDLLNHLLSLRFDIVWRKRVARRFRPLLMQPTVRVLDLCCGTGDLALALAAESCSTNSGPRIGIVAVDFSHPMLLCARTKAITHARFEKAGRKVTLLEADALAVPFADQTFDLITTAFGFRNLTNYYAALVEFRRLLRPGGSVAILEFSEPRNELFGRLFQYYFHHVLPRIGGIISGNKGAYSYLPRSVEHFPGPSELGKLMGRAGFADVRCERWTGGIVALHTGRRAARTLPDNI